MLPESLPLFSFILFTLGLAVAVIGVILTINAVATPLIRPKFQLVCPFLLMILGGLLAAFFGGRGLTSIPTPKRLEIQTPPDSVIRAEVIRNGQVIHQEEI